MKNLKTMACAALFCVGFSGQTVAEVCDYRPSKIAGGGGATLLGGLGATAAATGTGLQIAGFYTLVHAGSGLTMLGSTLAGASAAGTVGIIGGSAGVGASVAAVLMAPATIIAGVVTVAGIGAFEGACYFDDERITDIELVREILERVALSADPEFFAISRDEVSIKNEDGGTDVFQIEDLYIVNGVLMNDDWFFNTTIGDIAFVPNN